MSHSTLRRPGVVGVHSINRIVFTVPAIEAAAKFYRAFGLDVRQQGNRIDLHTFNHPHCWTTVVANGQPKKLQYVSFGIFGDDQDAFRARIAKAGIGREPHPLSDGSGLWLSDPDGTPIQLALAPSSAPTVKSPPTVFPPVAVGQGAAPARSKAPPVHPRRLSHLLRFSPDVPAQIAFLESILGMRLSDRSADFVAFLHGVHGSDHHMMAFVKDAAPGLHHMSWDVGSFHEVGWGAERMRIAGYGEGWGVGRHVLGSNYFHYVRDPWGSFSEYASDIDYVPVDFDWKAGDHPGDDSFYIWGPPVPEIFVQNTEAKPIA